ISMPEYAMPDVQITENWVVSTIASACPGGANGVVTLFVDSLFGQLPLQQVGDLQSVINLSSGATYFPVFTSAYTAVFTGLPAGNYQVLQTQCIDAPVVTFEIMEDTTTSAMLSAAIQNVSCFGSANGAIDLTVTGGSAPYAFTWSKGALTEDISGLTDGNYAVQVTDASGCSASQTYVLNAPPLLEITGYTTPDGCGNSNGSVSITVTGGSAPFTYFWSNGQFTEGIINVPAGSYTVVVTDAAQCSNTANFTVSGPSAPLISIGFNVT
ncbi:MAG: SprB repeat-containing protein, partial [Flavobacteriales bacterium]